MKQYKIYRLVDPTVSSTDLSNYVRYIGWTNKELSARLSNHISESKCDITLQHTHKNRWINKLLSLNIKPEIELVDETEDGSKILEMEIYYISYYKNELNCNLTNATKGGDGLLGRVVPNSQKALFEKSVDVYTKSGEFIVTIKSLTECAKIYNTDSGKISMVCNGKRKSSKNMVFRFHNDPFNKYEVRSNKGKNQKNKIIVYQINSSGVILEEYSSITEAASLNNIIKSSLQSYLRGNEFKLNGDRRQCGGKYFIKKILSGQE